MDRAESLRRVIRANQLLAELGGIDILDALEELKRLRAQPAAGSAMPRYPHPNCDDACHYSCTEAGTITPKCVAVNAIKETRELAERFSDPFKAGMETACDEIEARVSP